MTPPSRTTHGVKRSNSSVSDEDVDDGASTSPPGAPGNAPVKAACLFCRSRKSRCDGQQPCKTCISKNRENECVYTASRRGAKRRMIDPDELRKHLKDLLGLGSMPSDIRVPGKFPQLLPFQQPDLSSMSLHELNVLQAAIEAQRARQQAGGADAHSALSQPTVLGSQVPQEPSLLGSDARYATSPPASAEIHSDLRSLLIRTLEELDVGGASDGNAPVATGRNAWSQQAFSDQGPSSFAPGPAAAAVPAPALAPAPAPSVPASTGSQFNFPLAPTSLGAAPAAASAVPNQAHGLPSSDPLDLLAAQVATQQTQRQERAGYSRPDPALTGCHPARTRQLLTDFYLHLYMFLPVLLPPQHLDTYVDWYSSRRSPFLLALEAILPLLSPDVEQEPVEGPNAFNSSARNERRRAAAHFARQAGDAIDDALEAMEERTDWDMLIETLQALAVLSILEYGSSRAVKARIKADQALSLAMSYGMHRMSSLAAFETLLPPTRPGSLIGLREMLTVPGLFEMSKRVWWVTWTVLFYASFNTGKLVTIRPDDPRVTSALPVGTGMSPENEWEKHVSTLRFMLLVQKRVTIFVQSLPPDAEDALVSPSPAFLDPTSDSVFTPSSSASSTRDHIADSMRSIDKALAYHISELEKQPLPWYSPMFQGKPTNLSQVEASLSSYMRLINAGQLYTSWLCLHLYSAFQGASIFERKFCFLKCITEEGHKVTPHPTPSAPSETPVSVPPATHPQTIVPMPVPGLDTYGAVFAENTMATGLDPAIGPSDPGWAWGNLNELASQLSTDMPQPIHSDTTGDWLLRMAGINPSVGLDGVGAEPAFPTYQHPPPAAAEPEPSPQSVSWMSDRFTKPRGEHPFEARYSLERCVYASKRLLEILGNELMVVNPYLACEHVLTAFTLLVQALSVSNDLALTADLGGGQTATALLQSAQHSAALNKTAHAGLGHRPNMDHQQLLSDIWYHVDHIHSKLTRQAQHWDMVIPMAQEVQVCLRTSEMLFGQTEDV